MFIIGIVLIAALLGAWVFAARTRAGAPDLASVYADPLGARKRWWVRLPGPPMLLLLWVFGAPFIAGVLTAVMVDVASGVDHLYDLATADELERELKAAGEKASDASRVKLLAQEEGIAKEAQRLKQSGWYSPASVDHDRDLSIKRAEAVAAATLQAEIETAEAQVRLEHQSHGPGAVRLVASTYVVWGLLWILASFYYGRLWWRNRTPGGHHGFARWSRWGEITTAPDHRFVLPLWVAYYSTGRAWRLWERLIGWVGLVPFAPPEGDAVCSHYLVLGATGSGKGVSVFSHLMATSKVPTIYQDEKAECPMRDHPKWKDAIRWGCAAEGGESSQRWNPLEECRRDPDPENAFLTLAAALIPDDVAGGQNAWIAKLARPILVEVLASREYETLGDLADGVRAKPLAQILDNVKVPEGLKAAMKGENVSEYVTTTLYSELAVFRSGWGRDVTAAHDFALDDLIDRGGYILGAETEATRRGPIRLMWTLLLRRLMRSSRPRPCNLIMDEAAKAGRIPHFGEALVTLRSRGVSIWSAWQSESLVLSVYGEKEGTAILDGFGNRIALLHGISARDAETLSRSSGSWTKKRGGSLNFGLHRGGPSAGYSTGGGDISPIPLITATDLLIRSRTPGDRWAIISARGASAKGHLIMARLVEASLG